MGYNSALITDGSQATSVPALMNIRVGIRA